VLSKNSLQIIVSDDNKKEEKTIKEETVKGEMSYGDILSHMLWCVRFMPKPRFPLRFYIAYVTLYNK
jgi:hypothetical protein